MQSYAQIVDKALTIKQLVPYANTEAVNVSSANAAGREPPHAGDAGPVPSPAG